MSHGICPEKCKHINTCNFQGVTSDVTQFRDKLFIPTQINLNYTHVTGHRISFEAIFPGILRDGLHLTLSKSLYEFLFAMKNERIYHQ